MRPQSAPQPVASLPDGPGPHGVSLYVHVPFCVVKCGYCDFHSYRPDGEAPLDRYLEGLEAELRLLGGGRSFTSVFVGGGTPSYFDPARFERFWGILDGVVDLKRISEVTVEMNPESVTQEKGAIARAAGVTRVSLGAQSFSAHHLQFLDRPHDPEGVPRAVAALRAAGVDNLNLDMIFGVPGQTLEEWQKDLDAALSLHPDHLSCYHLTFEPGTRLTRDLQAGRVAAGDEDVALGMLLTTRERLVQEGFAAYEISNFAGRGGVCRHNDHYWLQGDSVGVGPGASSHLAGVRTTNLKAMEAWSHAVLQGLPGTAEAETLTPRRRLGEALWLGLRREQGIDLGSVGQRLGLDAVAPLAGDLDRFRAEGLLVLEGDRVKLTDRGIPLADAVSEHFLLV